MVKFSKVAKKAQKVVNWGPPPSGLEPIGSSGFYKTPTDKPISPTDCNHYPDSPFCGGNPFTLTPIGLSPSVSIDQCSVTGSVGGIVLFNKLPRFSVSYIKPECRANYNKTPPPPTAPNVPPMGKRIGFDRADIPYSTYVSAFVTAPWAESGKLFTPTWSDIRCPGEPIKKNIASSEMVETYISAAHNDGTGSPNAVSKVGVKKTGADVKMIYISSVTGKLHKVIHDTGEERIYDAAAPEPYELIFESHNNNQLVDAIYRGTWGSISKMFKALKADHIPMTTVFSYKQDISCVAVITDECRPINRYQNNPPPLADYNNKKDCCMQCCDSQNGADNSDLLKQILAEIQKANKSLGSFPTNATIFDQNENEQEAQTTTIQIGSVSQAISRIIERTEKVSKIIGIDALPLTVPDSICDPINDGILENIWDALTPDATRRITNLFEWNVWMLEQFSAVMGHWQMEIQVESEKPKATEGEEQPPTPAPKKIVIPDIRSCLKELLMLNIQQYKIQGLILDVALKDLTETASTKKEVVATQLNLREIVDFLDYQTDQESVNVPMQISVPGQDLSEEDQNDLKRFLEPTDIPVRYEKWNGRKSLTDLFTHLATLIRR